MTVSDTLKRLMIDTIASNINEIVVGFDGTPSTSSDGTAGRPAMVLSPTVTVIDDAVLLVEADIPISESFDDSLKEVQVQLRDASGNFTPISRHTIRPITKSSSNEVKIQLLIEVK
tara:strand:+ start:137 stop:484 length:348 start_codon:yes stop_codon:yes gene_type:complete